ncbi:MAG: hypothetical protein KGI60_03540 [Patescibacteria group bacterium]|nr:hypothetical protein [Patescibacteria group bacterium]
MEKILKDIREKGYISPFRKDAEQYLREFRKAPAPPSFAASEEPRGRVKAILAIPSHAARSVLFAARSIIAYIGNPDKSDYTLENPFRALFNKTVRKIRGLRNLNDLYDNPDLKEDFAYFPLHFEPEFTTLLYAPFYTNQINLLWQISKSLPVHFKIYVKEHPSMLEYRPTAYYKELKKIPNLKLVHHKTKSFDLITNSKINFVITGTTGMESALLKKPTISFGDVFYNTIPSIKRCREIESLPELVKEQLEHFRYNDEEIIDFLAAIFEDTIPFDYVSLWVSGNYTLAKESADFPKFVAVLAKKLNLNRKNQ